jgi:hypothetical protein
MMVGYWADMMGDLMADELVEMKAGSRVIPTAMKSVEC